MERPSVGRVLTETGLQMSERTAATLIAKVSGIGSSMARRMLAAGLAGEPRYAGGVLLYDVENVTTLLGRRPVDLSRLEGVGEAVLWRRTTRREPPEAWSRLPNFGVIAAAQVSIAIAGHGFLPVVVTCCGHVVEGAEAVGVSLLDRQTGQLQLRSARGWFRSFRNRTWHAGPGNCWEVRYVAPPRS